MNLSFVLVLVLDTMAWFRGRGRLCSWSQCIRKNERGLSMNLGWFGVPPSGGSNRLDQLQPGVQAVSGFLLPMHAEVTKGAP